MASRSTECNTYSKLKTKIKLINADIIFLKKCKQHSIFPKFMKITLSNNCKTPTAIIHHAKLKWLNNEINNLYAKRNKLEIKLYNFHLKLTKNLNNIEYHFWSAFDNKLHEVIQHKLNNKFIKLNKKFQDLIPKPIVKNSSIREELVINKTDEQFNKNEIDLLNKGLKYALNNKDTPLEELIASIESNIKRFDFSTKEYIRNACKIQITNNIEQNKNNIINNKDHKIINNLRKRDVFYLKADKGNKIVILNKADYFERVNNLITTGPYKEIKKTPLNKMTTSFKNAIKECPNLISKQLKYHISISNPVTPKMYCLPKIHKPGNSMRPIISGINSPTYLLSKWLFNQFKNFPVQPETFAVDNSIQFINKIKDLKLNKDEILVSFDVSALFPSIPIPQTLEYLKSFLENNNVESVKVDEYLKLTKVCMDQNYFQINNKFYQQTEGTAMGNSLSPFLANLFMSYFEIHFKANNIVFPRIWVRYVDDIFAIVNTRECNLDNFLTKLNSVFPSIKFTIEKEVNNRLPFLDVLVIRNKDHLEFDVYRKSTNTNRFIISDSNHHWQHKTAALNFLVNRLINFPLNKTRYNTELKYIKQIAIYNGYSDIIIDKLLTKYKHRKEISNISTLTSNKNNKTKFISLPYDSVSRSLNKVFNDFDIKISYKSNNTLKNLLGNPKDKIDHLQKSGIYQISCNDCDKVYIGQTRRQITTRFKEHINYIKYGNPEKSSVAEHIFQNNHNINSDNLKLLKTVNNVKQLDAFESINIFKNKHRLINSDLGPIPNSRLFDFLGNLG